MIVVEGVSHFYDNHRVLKKLSVQIDRGEMVFITGSSGAGKSTLLRLMAGAELPTSGSVRIGGYDTAKLSTNERLALRREVATIFQDPLLLTDLSVKANIALPLEILGFKRDHIDQRVGSAMKRLNLLARQDDFPNNLSVGQQQRVSIARALVNHPSIILADEPTGNLDYQMAHDVIVLLKQFQQRGTTVVVVSHDLSLIHAFDKRTVVIHDGSIFADLSHVRSIDDLKFPSHRPTHSAQVTNQSQPLDTPTAMRGYIEDTASRGDSGSDGRLGHTRGSKSL